MADPISWYLLGKSVGDAQTIREMVEDKVLTHNQDPSAHGQSAEALFLHRDAATLDHVAESVLNAKIKKIARAYKFVVDAGGDGDYTTIQPAIDAANADGGGIILVKAGTYALTANLILYTNIELIGDDDDTTIIDFNQTNWQVQCPGLLAAHRRNVRLRRLKFTNRNPLANTGAVYFGYSDDCYIEDCLFEDNYDSGNDRGLDVEIVNSDRFYVRGCRFKESGGIKNAQGSQWTWVYDNYFEDMKQPCIWNISTYPLQISGNTATGCDDYFVHLDSGGDYTVIIGNTVNQNAATVMQLGGVKYVGVSGNTISGYGAVGHGIYMAGCDRMAVVSNCIYDMGDCGIKMIAGSNSAIVGNTVYQCDDRGIYLYNAAVDKCTVVSNVALACGTNLTDNSGDSEVAHNIVA